MKISVILLFNHVDDNLNRCIESLLFGAETNVEIILSPYSKISSDEKNKITQIKSPKVVYINSVSDNMVTARENALTRTTGDYVLFPDPNDWVSHDFIKSLNLILNTKGADLIVFSYYMQEKESRFKKHKLERKNNKYYGFDMVYPIWNKVFSSNIIYNYKVGDNKDFSFLYNFIRHIQQDEVICLEKPLYYRGVENGLKSGIALNAYEKGSLKECFNLLGFAPGDFYQQELHFLWNKMYATLFLRINGKLGECKKERKEKKKGKVKIEKIKHFVAANIQDGISIISQNCIGGIIYHDLRRQNISPTINLYMESDDFIKFVKNLSHYLSLEPIVKWGEAFPIGTLDDIHIFFRHYKTCTEAAEAWNRRKKRVQPDKIIVLCTDRYKFTDESYEEWKTIDYPKLLFTCKKKYVDESSLYYKKYSKKEHVPDLIPYREFYKDDRLRTILETFEGI